MPDTSGSAKTYLSRVRDADCMIQRLCSLRGSLRADLYDGPYCQHTERIIARIGELERQIDAYVDELVALKLEILSHIRQMESLPEQNVLISRYIQLLPWRKIAAQMHYSQQQVYRLHGKALLSFESITRQQGGKHQ